MHDASVETSRPFGFIAAVVRRLQAIIEVVEVDGGVFRRRRFAREFMKFRFNYGEIP